jgi:hypothetical protein
MLTDEESPATVPAEAFAKLAADVNAAHEAIDRLYDPIIKQSGSLAVRVADLIAQLKAMTGRHALLKEAMRVTDELLASERRQIEFAQQIMGEMLMQIAGREQRAVFVYHG